MLLSLVFLTSCHKSVHKSEQNKVVIEKVELEEWMTGANGHRKLTMVFFVDAASGIELIPERLVFQHNGLYYGGKPTLRQGPDSWKRFLLTVDLDDGEDKLKGCDTSACLWAKVDGKVVSWEVERFTIRNADEDILPK